MATPCQFSSATQQFSGTPADQARCLLRRVRVGGGRRVRVAGGRGIHVGSGDRNLGADIGLVGSVGKRCAHPLDFVLLDRGLRAAGPTVGSGV